MPMARGIKIGIIGAVFAGMLGVAGYGAYNIYSSLDGAGGGGSGGSGGSAQSVATPVNTAPPSLKEVTDTAEDFLTAWSSGDTAGAAKLTDSPRTATAALAGYKDQAHVTKVDITPGTPADTRVPFTVRATVTYKDITQPWSYASSLKVVRGSDGKPAVQWAPSVLHPDLQAGDTLITGPAKSPDVDVIDRDGKVMDPAKYPSLTQIFAYLRGHYAAGLHAGTPGVETYIENADDEQTKTLDVLRKGVNAKLRTTLDAGIQAAAEKAVKTEASSGVTALDTLTGGILAVAFNPATGQNLALQANEAPGSTFKIVTATALLNKGLTPQTHSQCVSGYARPMGKPYTNVTRDNLDATLEWDFAQSCNTGFIRLADNIGPTTLADTAGRYYGLGSTWYVGTPTSDGQIPGGTGDELTSEMIGQGQVLMTTLNMASVSATVRNGQFHQPSILQDSSVIEKRTAISTSPLPPGVQSGLQQMMRATVTGGTAYATMHTFGGVVGAKTGSAEENQGQPNGWFTAYHDHVAAAALVMSGGHGGDSAGPIVASVLRAGS